MAMQWRQAVQQLVNRFENADLSPGFEACDPVFSQGFQQNFQARVDENGVPWAPHAASTVAKYGPHPLLILSGLMREQLVSPGASGHKFVIEGDSAVYGVSGAVVPYAIFHRTGTSRMPRRNVVYASAQTVQVAAESFKEAVTPILVGNFNSS